MTVRAAWLPPAGQTRADTRAAPIGTMTPAGPANTAPGVIPGGDPLSLTGAAAMQAQLGIGRAVVQGSTLQGAYPVAVTAPESLTFAPGHTQYDRIDLVVLRVYDQLFDTSGQTLAAVEIIPGTPASAPVAPAAPACSLPLWQVRVPVGASAGTGGITWATAVTDLRTFTVSAGGIRPDKSTDPGAYIGQWRDNNGRLERWSGSKWVDYPSGIGGIAPALSFTGGYIGQWRDSATGLDRWDGSAWIPLGGWKSYTPTWSGLDVLGASTFGGRYCRIGKRVDVVAWLNWGTGGSLGTGSITVSLPFTAANPSSAPWGWQGTGRYIDGGGNAWKSLVPVVERSGTAATVFAYRQSDLGWVSPGGAGYYWGSSNSTMRVQLSYESI
ncbi:hypothetical protein [Streptomyces sp. 1331.2]|uniref:hypothetical protein n=1 Tax=Streptomyces sp. 1331.2 TaxID=1938835 RepID=UPI000BCC38B9|nr:hypothetical protein [Streptomyces sp. 1331.2]SOB83132.1 hypothetical protein SAMN06272789_3330 [Streptomyces sp. 1331.2]